MKTTENLIGYNIVIAQPNGYNGSNAIYEMAELVMYSLRELGHYAELRTNLLDVSCRNILFCSHLVEKDHISSLPESTIIFNSEQMSSDQNVWSDYITTIAQMGFEIWDYSQSNIDVLKQHGVNNTKLFKIGYQKELDRLDKGREKDIDLLFYGSVNLRRGFLIDELRAGGLNVKLLFDVYGAERDEWISRSKAVMNVHFHETEIFEIVRVSYLLTNGIPVIAELNPTTSIDPLYKDAFAHAPYEEFAQFCIELMKNRSVVDAIGRKGQQIIKNYPQALFTKAALA